MSSSIKNIHVIQTDKPSRLIKSQDNDFVYLNTNAPNWFENNLKTTKQNIYITSDEEIKEGDWVTNGLTIMIANLDGQPTMDDYHPWKKIILTTDQDLIKDGVQAIDDEFLKWWIKNPSCDRIDFVLINDIEPWYKIRFPKEEPKQRLEKYSERFDNKDNEIVEGVFNPDTWGKRIIEEPKQETLEEALERIRQESFTCCSLSKSINYVTVGEREKTAFYKGAKWSQERSYSEEEVRNIVEQTIEKFYKHRYVETKSEMKELWFEQFKKK
jgi:hypothetical protein